MTPAEMSQLKKLIVATAMYYGQTIPDQVLSLYLEDLADLPFGSVVEAIRAARRDPKTTRFPLPATIRARIAPVALSDEEKGVEAASKIIAAIAKYGWPNPGPARAFIGEVGWRVVEMEGGWENVCKNTNQENLTTLKAQWRNLAKVVLLRWVQPNENVLPLVSNRSEIKGLLEGIKSIPKSEGGES